MKTHLLFFAFGLAMLMAACQKDESPISESFAPPASERCGCLPPVAFEAKNVTNVSADIVWNAMPEAIGYRIEITGSEFSDRDFTDFYVVETSEENDISLANLFPNTVYKYRVTTICGNSESSVSETMSFKTKVAPPYGDPDVHLPKLYKNALAEE